MNKCRESFSRAFITYHQPTEDLQPRVGAFDDPSALVAPELSPVLVRCYALVRARRNDRLNVTLDQQSPNFIAVVATICNQPTRLASLSSAASDAPFSSVALSNFTSDGEAFSTCIPSGVPVPSASTMSFVPLLLLVFPTSAPPFLR